MYLTKRGEALRTVIRRTVTKIEKELEADMGASSFAQLRKLLVRLNDTDAIRAEHEVS